MPTRYEAILKSVSDIAQLLFESSQWSDAIASVLRSLGEAAAVSRVYVFRCHRDADSEPAASQCFEWVAEGVAPQIDNPRLQNFRWSDYRLESWYRALAARSVVRKALADIPPVARPHFTDQDIQSLLLVPVNSDTHICWGFLGFDDCVSDRQWDHGEIEALTAAANILGNAIGRQVAEKRLKYTNERYRLAERASNIGSWDWHIPSGELYWSETIGPMFGFFAGDFAGTYAAFLDCVHPDDRHVLENAVTASLEDGKEYCCEHRAVWPDGSVHWVLEKGDVIRDATGKPVRMIGVVQDITASKRTKQALAESEQRFRNLVETTSDWIWEVDTDAVYTYASPKIRDLLGYDPQEIIGKRCFDLMPAAEAERVSALFADIAADRRPFTRLENINLHRNGRTVVIETSGVPVFDEQGALSGYRGIDRDVSDRKQTESALHNTEELFKQLADNVREVFFVRDLKHNTMVFVSPAYEVIWNDRIEAVYRDPNRFLKFIHPGDRDGVVDCISGPTGCRYCSWEFRIVRSDGDIRWIWWRGFPVRDKSGDVYRTVYLAEDITQRKEAERKRLENEHRQRETVVREVHHRIKNNLQGIIGLLRQQLSLYPGLEAPMEAAIGQVRTIAMVHGLQGRGSAEAVYLCEMVRAIADAAQTITGKPVAVHLNLRNERPFRVHSEEAVPLALIINELVTNAAKHSPAAPSVTAIRIEVSLQDGGALFSVVNVCDAAPADFDFSADTGLGTGLGLVRSLLPQEGAALDIVIAHGQARATLFLLPPVIEIVSVAQRSGTARE